VPRGHQVGFRRGNPNRQRVRECPIEIRGVFFDLYGTLLVYGDMAGAWAAWLSALRNWLRDQGRDIDTFDLAHRCDGFFSRPEPALKPDGLTVYENRIQELCSELGIDPPREDLGAAASLTAGAWQQYVHPDPEASSVLSAIGKLMPLALISNFDHPPHVRRVLEETGLATLFQSAVISAEVGVKKPDPRIFSPALNQLGLKAANVLYVGDAPEDVRGAAAAGMVPVRIQRHGDGESTPGTDFGHAKNPMDWTGVGSSLTVNRLGELLELLESLGHQTAV